MLSFIIFILILISILLILYFNFNKNIHLQTRKLHLLSLSSYQLSILQKELEILKSKYILNQQSIALEIIDLGNKYNIETDFIFINWCLAFLIQDQED